MSVFPQVLKSAFLDKKQAQDIIFPYALMMKGVKRRGVGGRRGGGGLEGKGTYRRLVKLSLLNFVFFSRADQIYLIHLDILAGKVRLIILS